MFEEQFEAILAQCHDIENKINVQKEKAEHYKKRYHKQMQECVRLRKILRENNIEF